MLKQSDKQIRILDKDADLFCFGTAWFCGFLTKNNAALCKMLQNDADKNFFIDFLNIVWYNLRVKTVFDFFH